MAKETIGVSNLSGGAQKRADALGNEGDWVFARRYGRGWRLAVYDPSSTTRAAADKAYQAYIDDGWQMVDFGR